MAGWFTFVPEYITNKNGKTVVTSFGENIHNYIFAIPLRDYFNNNDNFYATVNFDTETVSEKALTTFSYRRDSFFGKKDLKLVSCNKITYPSGDKFSISLPSILSKTLDSYLNYLEESFNLLKKDIKTCYAHCCFSVNKDDFFNNDVFLELLEIRSIGKFNKEKGITVTIDSKNKNFLINEQILKILKDNKYSESADFNIIDSKNLAKGLKNYCIEQNFGKDKFFELLNIFISNLYELDTDKNYIQIDFGVMGEDVRYRIFSKLKDNTQGIDFFLNNTIDGYLGYLMPKNWKDLIVWDNCTKILKLEDIDTIIDELTVSIEKSKNELDMNNNLKDLNNLLEKQTGVSENTLKLYYDLLSNWIDDKEYITEDLETMESTLEEFKLFRTLLLRDLDTCSYDSARVLFTLSE